MQAPHCLLPEQAPICPYGGVQEVWTLKYLVQMERATSWFFLLHNLHKEITDVMTSCMF